MRGMYDTTYVCTVESYSIYSEGISLLHSSPHATTYCSALLKTCSPCLPFSPWDFLQLSQMWYVTAKTQNGYYLPAGRPTWNWKRARQVTLSDTTEGGCKLVPQSFRRICLELNFSGIVYDIVGALSRRLGTRANVVYQSSC